MIIRSVQFSVGELDHASSIGRFADALILALLFYREVLGDHTSPVTGAVRGEHLGDGVGFAVCVEAKIAGKGVDVLDEHQHAIHNTCFRFLNLPTSSRTCSMRVCDPAPDTCDDQVR
jgi:hypothetical protein